MVAPVEERIDLGEIVLEDGAKILASHSPGKAADVGPLHTVSFQQDCENTPFWRQNVTSVQTRDFILTIMTRLKRASSKRSRNSEECEDDK